MKRGAALALVALLANTPLAATPVARTETPLSTQPLSMAAFRERLAETIAKLRPHAAIEHLGETGLRVTEVGTTDVQINADNAYAQYQASPETLTEILQRYAKLGRVMQLDDGATVEQLVVIVRPSDYITSNTVPGANLRHFVAPREMAGDLSYFLAVDTPETIRTATTDDLARWHLDLPAAWSRAVANLRLRVGALSIGQIEGDPSLASAMTAESGLAPSVLAQPFACSPEHRDGVVSQVVLVIAKNVFLFGVPSDPGSMSNFWRAAKVAISRKKSLSFTPLTCREGRWQTVSIP